MDCPDCNERLADFLLDELPEREAVLVQEHLNMCGHCLGKYRELKGTGKALEAIPSMKAIKGSETFRAGVQQTALVELASIVEKLPPDKRLKLEARRANRMSQVMAKPLPPIGRPLAATLIVLVAGGIFALAVILFYPTSKNNALHTPLGTLTATSGHVDQFYQKEGEPHTAVDPGKPVLTGNAFSTTKDGRARFDLNDDIDVFLGPSSHVTFRGMVEDKVTVVLESGEMGIRRASLDNDGDPSASNCDIRTECGRLLLGSGAHVYVRVDRHQKDFAAEVLVLDGSCQISDRHGRALGVVQEGQRATFSSLSPALKTVPVADARIPAWRLDLLIDSEMTTLFGAGGKVCGRRDGGVEVEISYSRANQRFTSLDWQCEPASSAADRPSGALSMPAGARLRHVVPFCAPLSIELSLDRDSQRDAPFAFGVLETSDGGVSVDVGREATLRIREKNLAVRGDSVPARVNTANDKLRLNVTREPNGLAVQLSSNAARTSLLPLPREKALTTPTLWVQTLAEGIVFSEIRISGVIPTEWLRERLSH